MHQHIVQQMVESNRKILHQHYCFFPIPIRKKKVYDKLFHFNSATTPIIISISVMLSLIGVLFGLLIFRMEFVVLMTMIGIISLAGIVVNNAIVLIDYINLIIKRKKAKLKIDLADKLNKQQLLECVVEGGKTRLRPVLLTAITTILGLLPLALGININFRTLITQLNPNFYIGGENVAFWGPMGWAIIFGLSFATFLTLIIVPILFYIINGISRKNGKDDVQNNTAELA